MNTTRVSTLGVVALALVAASAVGTTAQSPGTPSASPPVATAGTPVPFVDGMPELPAGTYYFEAGHWTPGRFLITVPDGWESLAEVLLKDLGGPGEVAVGPWIYANIYADPCYWQSSLLDPPIGPTVEDLATALVGQVGRNASVPTDVMLGGYPAKRIDMSVPADLDVATCDQGKFRPWLTPGDDPLTLFDDYTIGIISGRLDTVYIADVHGVRLVIDAWHTAATPVKDLAELEGILASIVFEPPPSTSSPAP